MKRILILIPVLCICACASAPARAQQSEEKSLGDVARELRDKKQPDVQVTPSDAKELFAAVDELTAFASSESGYPKRTTIKRKLVGHDHVARTFAESFAENGEQERLLRSELVFKKFGLVPATFDLAQFLSKDPAKAIGGYYNFKDKMMYLLDWIPLDKQRPIMAHELTHALQDQNYDLARFIRSKQADAAPPTMSVDASDDSEHSLVRRAVVEGQAMVVYLNYSKPDDLTPEQTQQAINFFINMLQNYDSPVALRSAPWVLQETAAFPYREGFAFELELLRKRGRDAAFAGAFARPPRSTHDVLEPDSYIREASSPIVTIPDLKELLGSAYQPYDSGSVGELDVRTMAKQFGRENDMYLLAPNWNGGAYVAVKRVGGGTGTKLTTSDLALVYVSRWKSLESAKHFAELYKRALPKRLTVLQEHAAESKCNAPSCTEPLWSAHLATSEGPTLLEIWPGNVLLITQSFDESLVSRLRPVVLAAARSKNVATQSQRELGAMLYESASFLAFQEQFGESLLQYISATSKR
jgi:hypothetical protein